MSGELQFSVEGSDAIFTRTFDAPRELVFQAWTDPQHLARWWGPAGVTNKDVSVDPRKGGSLRLTMASESDGWESPVIFVFREFEPPELLVMSNFADDMDDAWAAAVEMFGRMTTTITLEDIGGATELTMRTRFDSPERLNASVEMGAVVGWGQSLDRLAATLATMRA